MIRCSPISSLVVPWHELRSVTQVYHLGRKSMLEVEALRGHSAGANIWHLARYGHNKMSTMIEHQEMANEYVY